MGNQCKFYDQLNDEVDKYQFGIKQTCIVLQILLIYFTLIQAYLYIQQQSNINKMSTTTPLTSPQIAAQPINANKNSNIKLALSAILAITVILMLFNPVDDKNSNSQYYNKDILTEGNLNETSSIGLAYASLQQAKNNVKMGSVFITNYQHIDIQAQNTNHKIAQIDRNCKYLSRFTINANQIIYNGPTQKWSQLQAYKPIPYDSTFRTQMQVTFTAHSHIIIGITSKSRILQQSSYFNKDTYAYYGNNGCVWAQGNLLMKDQTKGFKEKDIIEVVVQLWRGLIQWRLNGKVIGQVYSRDIENMVTNLYTNNNDHINNSKNDNDKNNKEKQVQQNVIEYVPYIEMFQKGDQITIIQ